MKEFSITTEYIQLNQLLKLLGWAETGSEANNLIAGGNVKVNGEIELRKRNKIYPGFSVEFNLEEVKVVKG